MGCLAISDLTPMGGEPRVSDRRLSEILGFEREDYVRRLIVRHITEIKSWGVLHQTDGKPSVQGGRPTQTYWLNEGQAILICIFSRTDKAAEVRYQIITVYMAYRRGELVQEANMPAPVDQTVVTLQRLEKRLEALEAAGKRLVKLYAEPLEEAMALSHAVELWSGHKSQRHANFWHDLEVRGMVLATYRQMTVDQARAMILERCGADRTPSRSSLHRFWQQLDRLRNQTPSLRMH